MDPSPGIPRVLQARPLSRSAFEPFGEVLDASGPHDDLANDGAAQVFRDRARVDVAAQGGRVRFNIVRTSPSRLPLKIEMMERHPLGSQAFAPLGGADWLVVAAPPGQLDPSAIVAFSARGNQGINYRRGVWHHPLIALDRISDFLVIDRAGEGTNLDIERLAEPLLIESLTRG
jgi:ureidoglycolate lyase